MANDGIFSGSEFTLDSLVAGINDIDHIPQRAGVLAFSHADVSKPVTTLSAVVERDDEEIHLVPTTARGGPAEKLIGSKRTLFKFDIPHIQIEDTIYADSVQNVREFGTTNQLTTVQSALNKTLTKMARRLDLTLEHHRLGALKGQIRDADGSVLLDLYQAFNFLNSDGLAGPEVFDFDLDSLASESDDIRVKAQAVHRYILRNARTPLPKDAYVWAFCGDNFFDKLISRSDVKDAWRGTEMAAVMLADNYAHGVFEFGGVFWENYQGTDDNETVAMGNDECRFFIANAPALYSESFAPADYMETVNTPGLPRYAKAAVDPKFGKFVDIEAQTNPLPLCVRPATLCKGVSSAP